MATGWFIVPYRRDLTRQRPTRYCAMDDYTATIRADGGDWTETEVLGDRAIVKVRASAALLSTLAGVFKRLPKNVLDDSLADLPSAVKSALVAELEDMGYTLAEIRARFGTDLGQYTLRDVLRFAASRRLKPRYDAASDTIVCDGEVQACRSIEGVDVEIQNK